MLPHLRLRRTLRRLIFSRKGFSSIVGAVFAALIMISLISTVFIWSLSQNTQYNNIVRQSNQADLDRTNEKVMTNMNVTRINNGMVSVNGTLENYGSLSVQILTLWVQDSSNNNYNFTTLNLALPPGNITTLSGSTAVNVVIPNLEGDSLSCWFISARGNTIFEKTYSPTINVYNGTTGPGNNSTLYSAVASGIGAFGFDFTSFRYYNVSAGRLVNFINISASGDLGRSCEIPWGGTIAFSFDITNLYPTGQNLTLDPRCEMWSYFPAAPGQATGPIWYVSTVNQTTGVISPARLSIALPWNVTKTIYFAIQDPAFQWRSLQKDQLGAINLLMYGKFTGPPFDRTYAQNIPFISVLAISA